MSTINSTSDDTILQRGRGNKGILRQKKIKEFVTGRFTIKESQTVSLNRKETIKEKKKKKKLRTSGRKNEEWKEQVWVYAINYSL